MTERIEASVYQTRRHKKNAYYLACGSNVDGRLGISGTNEGCQARLVSLALLLLCICVGIIMTILKS